MQLTPAPIFLLLLLPAVIVISEVYYIKPTRDYQCSIHNHPCLTLEDFINARRNIEAHTLLRLLPGNHSLSSNLQVVSIKTFQISSEINSSWIVCEEPNTEFQFFNVTMIEIRNLRILGCNGCKVIQIHNFIAENCTFLQSNFSFFEYAVIFAINSTIKLRHCSFTGTYQGGVFYLSNSEVSSNHSTFSNNTSTLFVLDKKNIAIFHSCKFQTNTAVRHALVVSNASIIVLHDCLWERNTFQNKNFSEKYEFLIHCIGSIIVIRETTINNNMQTYATTVAGGLLMAAYSDVSFHNCNIMHNYGQNYVVLIGFSNTSVINTTIFQNNPLKGYFLGITDGTL